MAKVSVGSLCTFNHENQDWSVYKERLEQWFLANDLESEGKTFVKRRAVLLSGLAESTYKLVRDLALPNKINSLEYDAIVKLLDEHFECAKCGFAERNRFYTSTQRPTEELAEWAARVRGLAADCAFPASGINELLRDRFVLGMTQGPERDKLFTMDMAALTLSKALETAQAIRSARIGAAQAAPGAEAPAVPRVEMPAFKMAVEAAAAGARARQPGGRGSGSGSGGGGAVPKGSSCPVCGYAGHGEATCKFKRYKCGKCGERGHLRRVCAKKRLEHHFVEVEVDDVEDDGLFPIPEYPELEGSRGMWSAALDAILTTLRYLAPATILTLFWGQQSFLFRLLKSIDSGFRAIFSSEEQKQEVLQWLADAGPVRVERLDTVWRHGWILCGVLDAALPGACAGHPPTRLNLKHAQAIADHYLGVEPVFSRQELETNDSLSRHQEWKLATYLDRIRQALSKLTPPVSKPTSQRTSPETTQYTLDYVARGSGLTAAQVHNKMYFKIYPTSQQSLDPGELTVLIRGPKDTYGMAMIPPILGKAQLIRQKLLGLQAKKHYTETALPLTQGATYMRSYGKNDMNKTYHIPKTKYDIEIDVETQSDHAKVGYVVNLVGKYEISITTRGQNIVGSPFSMTSSKNIISILEKESFCLEDGEEIDIVDVKNDRKVVLRIVDFVTEKMLLKENGCLEKITEDDARILMSTDQLPCEFTGEESRASSVASTVSDDYKMKSDKFNKVALKVVQMNRVCKIINSLLAEKKRKEKAFSRPRTQQDIPDIVNSTFSDTKTNPFIMSEKRDKLIIPEPISVSLTTEKTLPMFNEEEKSIIMETSKSALNANEESDIPDSLNKYESLEEQIEDITERPSSSGNPFLNEMYEQSFVIEKDLGSFVKTEYETNKAPNEEALSPPITILVENAITPTPSPTNANPFVDPDIIAMERPKTPVLKIITGDVKNRSDSIYVDGKTELAVEEILANEFINPFFIHHLQNEQFPVADFIIGAPVSLPPIVRAATPDPDMSSLLMNAEDNARESNTNEELSSSVFSTPVHTTVAKFKEVQKSNNVNSSTFYSIDSNETDNIDILSLSNGSDNQEPDQEISISPRKDIWDSAYVSIDDNNSSPDSNNNDNNHISDNAGKQKLSFNDTNEYTKMGPAEREIWQTCSELTDPRVLNEIKPKLDVKRPIFTPIVEESDRSISTGMKDRSEASSKEQQTVTVAFAELNKYCGLFSSHVHSNTDYTIDNKDGSVDSASAVTDVKRHANEIEGKISEVQANVTESVSASQTLHGNYRKESKDETQFGDKHNNIVLEKKQYWDERIREIEAKSTEEDKTQLRRRRLSAKHLRHNDSLTKRRGKQIVKKFLNAGEQSDTNKTVEEANRLEIVNRKSPITYDAVDSPQSDVKLVKKWKSFWDNKLESEKEFETTCFRTKSPKSKESSASPQQHYKTDDLIEAYNESIQDLSIPSSAPVKQELPEEVFKAFETSPKRFFGTSRKQILNKIDTFLGKPSTADESSPDISGAKPEYDTGLVSSRISLFHNISQTEELPRARRKYHSMQNIFQRKDSERSVASANEEEQETHSQRNTTDKQHNERKSVTIDTRELKKELDKSISINALKDKRARMVQSTYNNSFDETVYKKPLHTVQVQDSSVKKTIRNYNSHNNVIQKQNVLRKSSVSKSEMDIFTKITNKPVEDDLDKYKSCDELPKINVKNFINLYESVSKSDVKAPVRRISRTSSMRMQRTSLSSLSTGAVNNTDSMQYSKKPANLSTETDESTADLTQTPENHWNKDLESASSGSYEPRSLDSMDIDYVPTKGLQKQTTYVSLSDIELEIVENADKVVENVKEMNEPDDEVPKLTETKETSETNHTDYKSRFKMAKQYFQSLEELRELKRAKKPNECELLLMNKSTESLETERPQKRVKKGIKSHSMPSSEISKIWSQLQESQDNENASKLVKISEKFNVDDLFNDVMEGRLSRQGSLRGIPNKKAVLETFKSMENLANTKVSSYEIAISQLNDFAKENSIKNAQTYLTEYPYLPTTDPSKYHSRFDARASGLISLKELHSQKPRRNSVPDLRLNPSFTVQL